MNGKAGLWREVYQGLDVAYFNYVGNWHYRIREGNFVIEEVGGFYTRKEAQKAAQFAIDFMAQDDGREYVVLDDNPYTEFDALFHDDPHAAFNLAVKSLSEEAFEKELMFSDDEKYRLLMTARYPQPSASEIEKAWQDTLVSGAVSVSKPSPVQAAWQRFENLVNRAAWMDEFEMLMEGK